MSNEYDFEKIYKLFDIDGEYVSCEHCGEGHINGTFCLTVNENGAQKHYLLQRINNHLFTDVEKLMHNIELITDFCRESVISRGGDPMRECMNIVRTKEGKTYCLYGKDYFRVYVFIENATTLQIVRNAEDFYQRAVAFGNFAALYPISTLLNFTKYCLTSIIRW